MTTFFIYPFADNSAIKRIPLIIGVVSVGILWWLSRHNFFFWDTVQFGSIHAHFYYESGFDNFFLPLSMNSGHPPSFGMYIAILWKLLGKTLFVSHLAMLPFLLLLVYHYYKLITLFISNVWAQTIAMLIFCLDPCFAGQMVLVSPDIVLLVGFTMSLRGILEKNSFILSLGLVLMCLISMRGYMVSAGLGLYSVADYISSRSKADPGNSFVKTFAPFVPGAMIGVMFLLAHYLHYGWIGYHDSSPWVDSFVRSDLKGMLKNLVIIVWRMLDFGRIFMWLPVLFAVILVARRRQLPALKDEEKSMILILLCLLLLLLPSMILHQFLTGHRYLLPIFLVGHLLTWISISTIINRNKSKIILYSLIAIGLITGNRWIYPDKISMGWDSTLAHLPYYNMRSEMMAYMDEIDLQVTSVGSQFPNNLPLKYIDLSEMDGRFQHQDLHVHDYILHSNIYNDFSDEDIEELQNEWLLIKKLSKMGVHLSLYQKP